MGKTLAEIAVAEGAARARAAQEQLRDDFAMQIVPALVAAGITMPGADRMSIAEFDARIAARAYAIADAMLEARKSER